MERCRTVCIPRKKTTEGNRHKYHQDRYKSKDDEIIGDQYLNNGLKKFSYFRCDRFKLEHKRVKYCKFYIKPDSSLVNSQEVMFKKFDKLKAARKKISDENTTTGSQHVIDAQVFPSDEILK